ncbi:hypothetical protein PBI_SCTP2_208 [Salicola phage SCTP-2]|nr:hypothetical protein PBI_SCTP2_208 [Salicola phage SCTP-2]
MELSNSLKKRFVKDHKLPITVLQEPYFSYYIDLLDPYYDTYRLLSQYKDYCNRFETQEGIFEDFQNVTQTIIDCVKSTNAYELFTRFDMSSYQTSNPVSKTSFYNGDSPSIRNFLSIDLKKANFQALKFFDPELVLGYDTYEGFIEKAYGDSIHPHVKNSKQIRQVIFGNLNPKRQQTIQKYLMGKMVDVLMDMGITEDDLMISSPDEIIVDDMDETIDIDKIIQNYPHEIEFHMDHFMLYRIHEDYNYFVKIYTDHSRLDGDLGVNANFYELKNVPAPHIAETIKYLFNKEVNEYDKTFYMEGRLAQYKDNLF